VGFLVNHGRAFRGESLRGLSLAVQQGDTFDVFGLGHRQLMGIEFTFFEIWNLQNLDIVGRNYQV